MGRRFKFTDQQVQDTIELYISGKSIRECSKLSGISESYIKNLLHKNKVDLRPSGFQFLNTCGVKPQSEETKKKISDSHKKSGHRSTKEAITNGQPKTLISRWKNHKKDYIEQLFSRYKKGADDRDLEFTLTYNEFKELVLDCCHYCGRIPVIGTINYNYYKMYNGVDRKDSNLGYTTTNCVTCCKMCNWMKRSYSYQDFIRQCTEVANHRGSQHVS